MKKIALLILVLGLVSVKISAQTINPQHVYWLDADKIFDYDPAEKKFSKYAIECPGGSSGLTIANNPLRNDELTFYTTVQGELYYFNEKKWVNTGHHVVTVNLAGGGKYIYILDGIKGIVYRYDGSMELKTLLEFDSFAGPYDLVCDDAGNFYLLFTKLNKLIQYDSDGKVIKEVDVEGFNNQSSGGGFAIVDDVVYANVSGGSMIGNWVNDKFVFEKTSLLPSSMNDFACVPLEVNLHEDDNKVIAANALLYCPQLPSTINTRKTELGTTALVTETSFTVSIWPNDYTRGTKVSFYSNGNLILKDCMLEKKAIELNLSVEPKLLNNYLAMYIEEGSDKDVTVEVTVKGIKKVYELTSNKNASGMLHLSYTAR